jgi:hypothetical protein
MVDARVCQGARSCRPAAETTPCGAKDVCPAGDKVSTQNCSAAPPPRCLTQPTSPGHRRTPWLPSHTETLTSFLTTKRTHLFRARLTHFSPPRSSQIVSVPHPLPAHTTGQTLYNMLRAQRAKYGCAPGEQTPRTRRRRQFCGGSKRPRGSTPKQATTPPCRRTRQLSPTPVTLTAHLDLAERQERAGASPSKSVLPASRLPAHRSLPAKRTTDKAARHSSAGPACTALTGE